MSSVHRRKQKPEVHEAIHEERANPRAVRVRNVNHQAGRLYIPPHLASKLAGRTLEWKRYTVYGQQDAAHEMELRDAGWEPVYAYQLPGMMPAAHKGPIVRDGLMLMERPEELTAQARAEERMEANERIVNNERRLGLAPPGELTRDHPDVQPRIRQTIEPMAPRAKQ